jgi:2-polyprenyl-3-methyl-5-hydroxy-6-metoxy-1,4-benzoquinol methylase
MESAAVLTPTTEERRDAFLEKMLQSVAGAMEVFTIYLGDQLGYYAILAEDGALTSHELASRTGTHERYAREWLEQQTVTGILEVENVEAGAGERRYYLPPGHDEVLADRDSLNYLAPLTQLVASLSQPLEDLLQAYRTGGGVPFEAYGRNAREGQARMNRASFLQLLGTEWLPVMPDVHANLSNGHQARVADIGCGLGWSSIGVAQSYPGVRVDGFDLDEASVREARTNAEQHGVSDRIRFHHRDAGDPDLEGQYDLVMTFECIHDVSDPVGVLSTARRLLKKDGAVFICDERVGEKFTGERNEVEHLMYGFSTLHCLPVGMTGEESAGTGTVMRPDILRRYAEAAGFREVEILPVDNYFFRFYRLR